MGGLRDQLAKERRISSFVVELEIGFDFGKP